VNPAVPSVIASNAVRPGGNPTMLSAGTRTMPANPPSRVSPRPMPLTSTASPGVKRASEDDSTRPATSMPALSGKRFRIFPRPVTASASLKLMPDHSDRMTTSPGVSASTSIC
jgi:hypothetical protein